MYFPQSLDATNRSDFKYIHSRCLSEEKFKMPNINSNWRPREPHVYQLYDQKRFHCKPEKINYFDLQVCNIIRKNGADEFGSLCQSQSFCGLPPLSYSGNQSVCSYMSPPPSQWITVGSIMALKRSSSMHITRQGSVPLLCRSQQRSDCTHSATKKKSGPFQCLKHQWRRTRANDNRQPIGMNVSILSQPISTPKLSSTKKPPIAPKSGEDLLKSRSIRKSISLLFSRSNRSSKSDPNIIENEKISDKRPRNKEYCESKFQHDSRRNHSYESMLERGPVTLSDEGKKSCSYSDVEHSSILSYRRESETSLYEGQLSSLTASCYGNVSCQGNEHEWKRNIGTVCRSYSKDSAITNSTLSGDGIIGQSKRVSLTSNNSKRSDMTTSSDDFIDSSYSSFNDLQTNSSQLFSYTKPRLRNALSNLAPLQVNYITPDSHPSPSTDSSTETLRPSSQRYRQHCLPSHSKTITNGNRDVNRNTLKRSHSWPKCRSHHLNTHTSAKKLPDPTHKQSCVKTSPFVRPTQQSKPDYTTQRTRNSSPLLSQYSKLYSLRSCATNNKVGQYCPSGATYTPTSPIKYANNTVADSITNDSCDNRTIIQSYFCRY